MGKHNQQRRAEKQRSRAHQQQRRDRDPRPPRDDGDHEALLVRAALIAAVWAARQADEPRFQLALEVLVARPVADDMVARALNSVVTELWAHGWQPRDLMGVVRRKRKRAHIELATRVIVHQCRRYRPDQLHPDWRSQLQDLTTADTRRDDRDVATWLATYDDRHEAWRAAVELLATLEQLPRITELLPPPGSPGAQLGRDRTGEGVDPKVLARVRALLAKAESTTFAEEAEAFTAKAAELMARHAVDRAMVESAAGDAIPIARRITIDDPYALAKAILLQHVAEANRCRTMWSEMLGSSTLIGFPVDLQVAEVLFTSLLVQATAALTLASIATTRARRRAYRQSFLVAYGDRIGQRLREAAQVGIDDGAATLGPALLPVLARRSAQVDDVVEEAFPHSTSRATRVTDGAGWQAGTIAADQARLSIGQEVLRGTEVA